MLIVFYLGFKFQAQILAQMCHLVDSGAITAPLFSASQAAADPNMTNQQYIREYLMQLLQGAFTNLQPYVWRGVEGVGWGGVDDLEVVVVVVADLIIHAWVVLK